MNVQTILNNDEYTFQYIHNNNNKLLIYIRSGQTTYIDVNKIDIIVQTLLKQNYDVIYIRNKNIFNMYDYPCDSTFNEISKISKKYDIVDGWFECGGSVLGLYFSKMINYRKIFCISPRFIEGMTLEDKDGPNWKYKNYRVTEDQINLQAEYYMVYTKYQNTDYDMNTAKWLKNNTLNSGIYIYDNKDSEHQVHHLIEHQMYFKTYLKDFIPNILNGNILSINNISKESNEL